MMQFNSIRSLPKRLPKPRKILRASAIAGMRLEIEAPGADERMQGNRAKMPQSGETP